MMGFLQNFQEKLSKLLYLAKLSIGVKYRMRIF